MTHEEWLEWKTFAATELGKLFIAFDIAHAAAWQLDTRAGYTEAGISDRQLSEIWAKEAEARKALIAKLKTLA